MSRNPTSRRVLAIALVALVLFPLLATAADATGRGKSRAHNAEFVMPDGWARGNNEYGNLVLVPPDQPQGERVEIHIAPFDQAPRGLRGHAEASVDNLKKDFDDVRVEQPLRPVKLPGGADAMTITVSAAIREAPGRRIHVQFAEVDGGDNSSQGFAFVATTPELFEKYRQAYRDLVNGATFPSLTALVPAKDGNPALTMYAVNTVTDFIEWALDVPFTQEQRDGLQTHLVTSWQKNDKTEIEGVGEVTKARLELDKITDANKKELARQAIRTEILKVWRDEATKGDAMAKLMVDIYDAANQPIAAGDPPLTRQAADATLEIVYFMASRVAGAPDVAPTKEQKETFAKNLGANYATMPAENRQELAKMPTNWAALRVAWPELAKDEQAKLTAAWATSEQVKPIAEQIKAAQAQVKAAAPKSDAMAAMELMRKMQQQQQTYTMLSNMSHQMHMSRMQIINNIGSSNYRYEYRPVYRYR